MIHEITFSMSPALSLPPTLTPRPSPPYICWLPTLKVFAVKVTCHTFSVSPRTCLVLSFFCPHAHLQFIAY